MIKDSTVYLEDIINSITQIEKYTENVSFERFEQDEYMQDLTPLKKQLEELLNK